MMPKHMTEALDKYFVIKAYGGANHARKIENRRPHYGVIKLRLQLLD